MKQFENVQYKSGGKMFRVGTKETHEMSHEGKKVFFAFLFGSMMMVFDCGKKDNRKLHNRKYDSPCKNIYLLNEFICEILKS